MYFSQYKSKPAKKNRVRSRNRDNFRKGLIKFIILAGIIVSVIPVVYFSDRIISDSRNTQKEDAAHKQSSYLSRRFTVQSVSVTGNNFVSM
ncbi:MAG TPA: hypothetical protein VIH39_02835, partial [Nitrospirota bacterium]